MPQGYNWSQKQGRWLKKQTTKTFDYDAINAKSAALLVSFFRYYPDYFLDLIRSPEAKYRLELPQRIMLRIFARYRDVYITGARGLTKTFVLVGSKETDGVFFPDEKIRYVAPSMKQSAKLASEAFKQLEAEYPLLASWWRKENDRGDMFRITTQYGSEFTMYAPRGDNCSAIVGEEMGQEGEDGFDMEKFEREISPTCRLARKIHGVSDRAHIDLKEHYIANACSRQNKAFTVYRAGALKDMIFGDKYDGYALDMSWISALLCNIRDIAYYKKERKRLTPENWLREMCVRYIGNDDNPMMTDDVLARSRKLPIAEYEHCGRDDVIYIVSHDVSYKDSRRAAKCADAVIKLTKFKTVSKRDKYLKQIVYADSYPPPATDYLQAQKVKRLWAKFCRNGAEATYIVVDAQAYGTAIVEELMKPVNDGLPALCCVDHMAFTEIEQQGALPVIYPLKSSVRGTRDEEGAMIQYAQSEFEQGNVEMLTPNVLDGVEAYKNYHNIKDNSADGRIALAYKQTDILAQQISNLRARVSGISLKEERKSPMIQRDIWSAVKYALHLAQILESELVRALYAAQSTWAVAIQAFQQGRRVAKQGGGVMGDRAATVNRLLQARGRK